jgi:hypothetical protein
MSATVIPLPGACTAPVVNQRYPGSRPRKIVNIRRGVGIRHERLEQEAREKARKEVNSLHQSYCFHHEKSQEITNVAIARLQEIGFTHGDAAVQFLIRKGL